MKWNRDEPEVRFWLLVKSSRDGCWEWQGRYANSDHYGSIRIGDRYALVHRYSWEIHFGEIPDGLQVCHKCDNRLCVRPDHLFLGTNQDNCDDKVAKNRQAFLRGELNGHRKLNDVSVRAIRRLHEMGVQQPTIAEAFGIHQSNVSLIVLRKTWAHVG